jgi:prophage antirepressor-like protein
MQPWKTATKLTRAVVEVVLPRRRKVVSTVPLSTMQPLEEEEEEAPVPAEAAEAVAHPLRPLTGASKS